MGIDSVPILEIERRSQESPEGITCERKDVVEDSKRRLRVAFERLGIDFPDLPKIEVKFVESQDRPELGRTYVDAQSVQVLFDSRFATREQEDALVSELKSTGLDYPGMAKTLTHEAGHIALWSVLKTGKHPATRLLDEGWATLLEEAGSREDFETHLKQKAEEILGSEPVSFLRCFDFRKPIDVNEDLNGVEYVIGANILLWIQEEFGNQVMLDALKSTLDSVERNDSLQRNNPETKDVPTENALKQFFSSQGIDDVLHGYLRWLMNDAESRPLSPKVALDIETIMRRFAEDGPRRSSQEVDELRKDFEGHLRKYSEMKLTLPISDEPMRRICQVLTENALTTLESCEGHGGRLPRIFLKCEDPQKLKELAFVVARASSYRSFPWQAEIWCSDPSDQDSPLVFILSPSQRHQPLDPKSNYDELLRDIDALGLSLMIHFDSLKKEE